MSGIDNGGQAFPSHPALYSSADAGNAQGMTLRDWFAGQALMSLPHLCAHDTLSAGETFEAHVARNAYALADAMLAARKGRGDG